MTAVEVDVAAAPPRRRILRPTPAAWTRADTIALCAISIGAGAIRWFRVTAVSNIVFDEVYYATRACDYVFGPHPPCNARILEGIDPVHPPLGTWLIALGIRMFGFRSGGWRLAALVAGTLSVAVVYLLARKILRSTIGAIVASGALALDFLHFVHSRVAMLDIFVLLFGVATVLCAVYDRDRTASGGPLPSQRRWSERLRRRRWRFLAGVAAGAAVASKWSGVWFLLAVVVLTFVWESAKRPRETPGGRTRDVVFEEGPSILAAYAIVPVLIYVVSYIGRLDGAIVAWPWADDSWVRALLIQQRNMLAFHLGLDVPHAYASDPWSWPLLKRPVVYDVQVSAGRYRMILATGNPLAWWPGLVAMAFVGVRWVRGQRSTGEGVILAGFAAAWLPWVALMPLRGTEFLFYFLPAVPFLCIALGYVARMLAASRWGQATIASYGVVVVATFVFFYPVLTAVPISADAWRSRMLFQDCDLEGARLSEMGVADRATPPPDTPGPYPEATVRRGGPPPGWCWI